MELIKFFRVFKKNTRLKEKIEELKKEVHSLDVKQISLQARSFEKDQEHQRRAYFLELDLSETRTQMELLREELIKAKRRIIQLETDIEAKK